MFSEARSSHAQSFLWNCAFHPPSVPHICMHYLSNLLQTTYLTYSFTNRRNSVKWLLFFSLNDTFTKQHSSTLCHTNLSWMVLIECYFFQHFLLNVFELPTFGGGGGRMTTIERFKKLANKICDCVRRRETVPFAWSSIFSLEGQFMAPQTPNCLASSVSWLSLHGLEFQLLPGRIIVMQSIEFSMELDCSIIAFPSEHMQLIDWILWLFFCFDCFLCFVAC